MRVLIACEESQTVCKAFRKKGHEAFSCDILDQSGGHPEWHLKGDVFQFINQGWDLMIAHPPCTYLAGSGVQWLSHPEDTSLPFDERRPHPRYPNRRQDMLDSVEFVKALYNANIDKIAIENPVGLLSSRWKKPDQIVHPYHFGDEATKATCLWLKNLPKLIHTNVVDKGEKFHWIDSRTGKAKSQPKWFHDIWLTAKTKEERQSLRSKTFQGIADAFAEQWG